jgi:diguanylate cyclase (GGDEF)-like protein/PAS domain S-box-containing protein
LEKNRAEVFEMDRFIRKWVGDLLVVMSIVGLPLFLTNLISEWSVGRLGLSLAVIPVYAMLLIVTYRRNRLSLRALLLFFLSILTLLGCISLFFIGMVGPGLFLMGMNVGFGALLLRREAARWMALLMAALLTLTMFLWVVQLRTLRFDVIYYATSYETFINRLMIFLTVGGLFYFLAERFRATFEEMLREKETLTGESNKQNEQLKAQDKELAMHRAILASSPNVIFLLDREGIIRMVNAHFCGLIGCDPDHVIGAHYATVGAPLVLSEAYEKLLGEVNKSRRTVTRRVQLEVDGARKVFDLVMTPEMTNDGGIRTVTVIHNNITPLVEKEERIERLAFYDNLTGLPNRLYFKEAVEEAISAASDKCAVLLFDLDDFKKVNDTLGHRVGDQVLKDLVAHLKKRLEPDDVFARLGGDEFALLSFNHGPVENHRERLMEKTRMLTEAMDQMLHIEEFQFSISISIGGVVYPDHGSDYGTLIKNAETAMYVAKGAGKNTFRIFDLGMEESTLESALFETHIRRALESGEIDVHFQPLVRSTDESIRGFEALMRWSSPLFGSVSPDRFIPVLEETGLILPFGEYVIRKACEVNRQMQICLAEKTVVSVNLSPMQFFQEHFVEEIEAILVETGLSGNSLEFEITENVLIESPEEVVRTLHRLKELGVRVALDDFGTGYSSLNYLRSLPIDTLKIDKSFIDDLLDPDQEKHLVGSIVALAHDLGLEVIAEGVETDLQRRFLQAEGCDALQGYYFYRPMKENLLKGLCHAISNESK